MSSSNKIRSISSDSGCSTSSTFSISSGNSQNENSPHAGKGRVLSNTVPGPMDIICGRGSRVADNPGNRRFHATVHQRKEEYQQAQRREDKTRITMEIIQYLTTGSNPSRFMLKDSDAAVWYEVGLSYAKDKVSHALRSRQTTDQERSRRKQLRQMQQQKEQGKQHQQVNDKNRPQQRRRGPTTAPRLSSEMENLVNRMIADQQVLLESLMRSQTSTHQTSMFAEDDDDGRMESETLDRRVAKRDGFHAPNSS